jgi:hypothetical protein
MKLKGFPLTDIEYHVEKAKRDGNPDEPIDIKLNIRKDEDVKTVKADLTKNYNVTIDLTFPFDLSSFRKSEKVTNVTLYAKVPAKNLREVIEKNYVNRYEWPAVLETLSTSPSTRRIKLLMASDGGLSELT